MDPLSSSSPAMSRHRADQRTSANRPPSLSPPMQSPASASPARSMDNAFVMQQSSATFMNRSFDRPDDDENEGGRGSGDDDAPFSERASDAPGGLLSRHDSGCVLPATRRMTLANNSATPVLLLSATVRGGLSAQHEDDGVAEQPTSSRPTFDGEGETSRQEGSGPSTTDIGEDTHVRTAGEAAKRRSSPSALSCTQSHQPRVGGGQWRPSPPDTSSSSSSSSVSESISTDDDDALDMPRRNRHHRHHRKGIAHSRRRFTESGDSDAPNSSGKYQTHDGSRASYATRTLVNQPRPASARSISSIGGKQNPPQEGASHRKKKSLRHLSRPKWMAAAGACFVALFALAALVVVAWFVDDTATSDVYALVASDTVTQRAMRNDLGAASALATGSRLLLAPLRRIATAPALVAVCNHSDPTLALGTTAVAVTKAIVGDVGGIAQLMTTSSSWHLRLSVECASSSSSSSSSGAGSVSACVRIDTSGATGVAAGHCTSCTSTILSTTLTVSGRLEAPSGGGVLVSHAKLCIGDANLNLFIEDAAASPAYVSQSASSPLMARAAGMHVVHSSGGLHTSSPLVVTCVQPSPAGRGPTLAVASRDSTTGCVEIGVAAAHNATLCRNSILALLTATVWPVRLTASIYVVRGPSTAPLATGSDVEVSSGGDPSSLQVSSFYIASVGDLPIVDGGCFDDVTDRAATAPFVGLWAVLPFVVVLSVIVTTLAAVRSTRKLSDRLQTMMHHVVLLCDELQHTQEEHAVRRKHHHHRTSSGGNAKQLALSSSNSVDTADLMDEEALEDLAGATWEMHRYVDHLLPAIRAKFVFYQSFLRKTTSTTLRLPTILSGRSVGRLSDSTGALQVGGAFASSVTSYPPQQQRRGRHPSLVVQPASPAPASFAASPVHSGGQPGANAFLFQLDRDASPLHFPSILQEAPTLPRTTDPNYISERPEAITLPTRRTSATAGRLFTPRPPSNAPGSPMLSAASPTGGVPSSGGGSTGGWSPAPLPDLIGGNHEHNAGSGELPTAGEGSDGARHPGVPPIFINRTAQQTLSVVQGQAMSMSMTSTAFMQSARATKTPRQGTGVSAMASPNVADASLLHVPQHKKHFHSHHSPRLSYTAGHDTFVPKRATVLTCTRAPPSGGVASSPKASPLEAGESFEMQSSMETAVSPRWNLGRTFAADSQRFLRIAIECADQCDGTVVEMTAHSITVCWNALSPYPFHEVRGVQCAMHMAAQLDEQIPDTTFHSGVVTGSVLVGHVGTSRTMRRCVLGISVYMSQLLPSLGRLLGCAILVSEASYAMARSRLTCVPIEIVAYDGHVMILYEALGMKDEQHFSPNEVDLIHRGFGSLCNGKFTDARVCYEAVVAASNVAASQADRQVSRLARVAKHFEEEQMRRMEMSGGHCDDTALAYGRNGPSWLIHEVAADDVRLPDDVLAAMGDLDEEGDSSSMHSSTRALTPLSSRSNTQPNRSPGASRRSSVNPIFELRAELEHQLLERTLRASAQSMYRSSSGTFLGDDAPIVGGVLSPDSRRDSSTVFDLLVTAPTMQGGFSIDDTRPPEDLMEIVDRRGQSWRRSNKCLGRGTFGEVYVGLQSDGSLCAIKMVSLPMMLQRAAAAAVSPTAAAPTPPLTPWGLKSKPDSLPPNGYAFPGNPPTSGNASFGGPPSSRDAESSGSQPGGAAMISPHLFADPGNHAPPCTPLDAGLCSPRPPPTSVLSKEVDQLLQEVAMLSSIRSDNVVRYFGSAVHDGNICIIMEYVGGGSLTSLLSLFGTLPLPTARRFIMDVLRGLKALHDQRIVHRDVGPNNVLVTIDGVCKLSDFGCSQSLQRLSSSTSRGTISNVAGTPQYMAPEACRGEATTASDVWSVGVLAHVLVTGKLPYTDEDLALPPDVFVKRLAMVRPNSRRPSAASKTSSGDEGSSGMGSCGAPPMANQPLTVCLQEAFLPNDVLEFLQVCLLRDHTTRPSAEQLMLHPFVLK